MINWVKSRTHSIQELLKRQREEMQFPAMTRIKGREVLVKQIKNGFLLAFNPQEDDQWLEEVVFCENPAQISIEIARFFSKKALTKP